MAIPPDDLEGWLELSRARLLQMPPREGLAELKALLEGWLDHRHFVAGDDDGLAQAFSRHFFDHVRTAMGSAEMRPWHEYLADDPAPVARFYELFARFAADPAHRGKATPRPPPRPEPALTRPSLLETLQGFRTPENRPGTGDIASLQSFCQGWAAHCKAVPFAHDPFAREFFTSFDPWLAWATGSRRQGDWAAQIAAVAGDEEPYAVFFRLLERYRRRLRDIVDKWSPALGDSVVPDRFQPGGAAKT
ncbi:hypothetical protein [Frigidibacter sp. ROC022]|uniref:hypothetical protein n=1 Tax=Frigidibacter sp. ROC022 TaxID=2971796 RepID=UPI00215B1212|nr:hypothetical protein [Frigidibacter sp. ROC022]MCR8722982.1 hypothetical protein [Frigidibacter sp. ROC022]